MQINLVYKGDMLKIFGLNPASTYYTLDRLEKGGYVEKRTYKAENRPQKYVYQLTGEGEEEFLSMIEDSLLKDPDPIYPIEIGLIFIDKLDAGKAAEMVRRRIEYYKERLEKLHQFKIIGPKLDGAEVPDHHWMLDHKIFHLQAEIDWEEKFLSELVGTRD